MATTTNYSWTTPDDTDLVKDGAAAIRTLGTSIDTTTKNLNPSTTLGDIEYRSSTANTNTRLGIGSSGQVLTVSGGVPAWATASSGGMTLLSTTTLSGATTTISVAGGYNSIVGVIYGCTNSTGFGDFYMAPNGTTNLSYGAAVARYPSTTYVQGFSAGYWVLSAGYSLSHTSANNAFQFEIDNYTSASNYKTISSRGVYTNNDSQLQSVNIQGGFASNTAITSLVFSNSGGNHSAGTVLIYGVK